MIGSRHRDWFGTGRLPVGTSQDDRSIMALDLTHHESRTMLHMAFSLVAVLSVSLSSTFALSEEPPEDAPKPAGILLFDEQIKPVLVQHCYECHSSEREEPSGGLELDSPMGIRRGGNSGPILVSHDVNQSLLLDVLRKAKNDSTLSPHHQLTDEVISAFEKWIRLGAPDSRQQAGSSSDDQPLRPAQEHWAFQPPKAVDPPEVVQPDWPRGAIDYFVLARIEAAGLTPAPDANRRTLARRVFFDLIGLPPSPQQVDAFVTDNSPDALANLIDQLLGSSHFGERWGRHWLDVVRYAESSGMEYNFTYPHAWPYRDYVIDALNQDKPYDLFLQEQIAGDLMPVGENESREAIEARQIAPSILAFGPKRHNSAGEFYLDVVDDQINTVFSATQALTVSCARCHDHKFDPISTRDYYALAGIFLSTQGMYGTIEQSSSSYPTELLPIGPDAAALHAAAEEYEKKEVEEVDGKLATKREALKKATEAQEIASTQKSDAEALVQLNEALAELNQAALTAGTTAQPAAEEALKQAISRLQKAAGQVATALTAGVTPQPTAEEAFQQAIAQLQEADDRVMGLESEIEALETRLEEVKKNRPPRPQYAMSARDQYKLTDSKIAIRGDAFNLGEVVPRGFLSHFHLENSPEIDRRSSGRLELAQWITNRQNPLTARVMVNRIWHHLFGRGLVTSVDNFGVIGNRPSHPQLLDALALEFAQDGWSVKRMIRSIMLSRAYQLSSARNAANMNIDPDNRLFWRATPRRLEAETIRDAILAVSGQLQLEKPVSSSVTPLGDKLIDNLPAEDLQPPSNHRSVYLPVIRDYVPELFDLFDFPSASLVSGRRSVTSVPAQALYLRNSPFIAEQTQHAARRLLAAPEATNNAERADLAVRWALARGISEDEQRGVLELVEQIQQTTPPADHPDVDAWAAWFYTLFNTAEFRYLVDIQ